MTTIVGTTRIAERPLDLVPSAEAATAADRARPAASRPAAPPDRVLVGIDELVLHGFAALDRRVVGDALERELSRLLAAGGSWPADADPPAPGQQDRVDAGLVTFPSEATADQVGTRLAHLVHAAIRPVRRESRQEPGG